MDREEYSERDRRNQNQKKPNKCRGRIGRGETEQKEARDTMNLF